MPDKNASTSSRFWRIIISLLIGLQLIITAIAVFRIGETDSLRERLSLMEIEHKNSLETERVLSEGLKSRVDELEHVLFGDVLAKVEKQSKTPPRLGKVEQWMLNRTKDIVNRLERLEQWRLRVEGK